MKQSPTSSPSGMQPTGCGSCLLPSAGSSRSIWPVVSPASRPSRNLLPTSGLLAQVSPADAAMQSAGAS